MWNIVLDRKVESGSVNASLTARDDLLQSSQLVAHEWLFVRATNSGYFFRAFLSSSCVLSLALITASTSSPVKVRRFISAFARSSIRRQYHGLLIRFRVLASRYRNAQRHSSASRCQRINSSITESWSAAAWCFLMLFGSNRRCASSPASSVTTRLERAAIKLHRFLHANLGGADQIYWHGGAHAGALTVA